MECFAYEIRHNEYVAPLRCYIPDGAPHAYFQRQRPAMIVFPGGGYSHTYEGEGEAIALKYVGAGFCSFVLNYSVYPAKFPQSLTEALMAIRYVRENAADFGIDPHRVYVCGFSAGGHLAACTGTLWNHACLDGHLEGARELYRPDGMVLSYPVITPLHRGSYLNLFGQEESALTDDVIHLLSLHNQVTNGTPPTFVWHNSDDTAVPVECSLLFGLALHKNKIPFEMRIWENGGHGVCLGNYVTQEDRKIGAPLDCSVWVDESVRFLLRH